MFILSFDMNPLWPLHNQITLDVSSILTLIYEGSLRHNGNILERKADPFPLFEDRTLFSTSGKTGRLASFLWLKCVSVPCECEGVAIIAKTPSNWTFPDQEQMEHCIEHLILRIKPSQEVGKLGDIPDTPKQSFPSVFITLNLDQVSLLKTMGWIDHGSGSFGEIENPEQGPSVCQLIRPNVTSGRIVNREKILRLYCTVKEELQKTKEGFIKVSESTLPGLVILDDSEDSPEIIVLNSDPFSSILGESGSSFIETEFISRPPCTILF